MGRKKFDADGYVDWMERVPQEGRLVLQEMFDGLDTTSYDGLVKFSQQVMVQVLSGNIPPVAAEAAAQWAEIALTALSARSAVAAQSTNAYNDLIDALTAVEEQPIEASYTTVEANDKAVNQ